MQKALLARVKWEEDSEQDTQEGFLHPIGSFFLSLYPPVSKLLPVLSIVFFKIPTCLSSPISFSWISVSQVYSYQLYISTGFSFLFFSFLSLLSICFPTPARAVASRGVAVYAGFGSAMQVRTCIGCPHSPLTGQGANFPVLYRWLVQSRFPTGRFV